MITNFQSKKMPRKAPCKCLSKIMLDSVIKAKKKYYPQTYYPQLLKECKYEQEKIKMENLIDDDLQKVCLMSLVVNLMMNLTYNLLKAKKI